MGNFILIKKKGSIQICLIDEPDKKQGGAGGFNHSIKEESMAAHLISFWKNSNNISKTEQNENSVTDIKSNECNIHTNKKPNDSNIHTKQPNESNVHTNKKPNGSNVHTNNKLNDSNAYTKKDSNESNAFTKEDSNESNVYTKGSAKKANSKEFQNPSFKCKKKKRRKTANSKGLQKSASTKRTFDKNQNTNTKKQEYQSIYSMYGLTKSKARERIRSNKKDRRKRVIRESFWYKRETGANVRRSEKMDVIDDVFTRDIIPNSLMLSKGKRTHVDIKTALRSSEDILRNNTLAIEHKRTHTDIKTALRSSEDILCNNTRAIKRKKDGRKRGIRESVRYKRETDANVKPTEEKVIIVFIEDLIPKRSMLSKGKRHTLRYKYIV